MAEDIEAFGSDEDDDGQEAGTSNDKSKTDEKRAGKSDDKEVEETPEDRKRIFKRELATMLYGFGDVKEPNEETLELLEKIVLEYIQQVCLKALSVGKTNRLGLDDIYYLIRRDPKKFVRVKELLSMSEVLKKAKKHFDDMKEVI